MKITFLKKKKINTRNNNNNNNNKKRNECFNKVNFCVLCHGKRFILLLYSKAVFGNSEAADPS